MIRDGRPCGVASDTKLLTNEKEEVQIEVLDWIRKNILPIKSVNNHHTSYGIKHFLQDDTGIYLTNNQFKDAMLMCGFRPENENALNWYFRISEKSPAFNGRKA